MSYDDDTSIHYCDGPGCEESTTNRLRDRWREEVSRGFGPEDMATSEDFCSPECRRRSRGFSYVLESAMLQVRSGSESIGDAVRRAMNDDLVLGEQEPGDAVDWARLMAHAWVVVAAELQHRHDLRSPAFERSVADTSPPGPLDPEDTPMDRLVAALMEAMHADGERIGSGLATVQECVEGTVAKLLPQLMQLALRRQSSLAREVREVVFPFRRGAEYQLSLAHELELAVARVTRDKGQDLGA